LLTTLTEALEGAVGDGEKDKLIDAFLTELEKQGGAPLVDPDTDQVAFVIRGAPFQGTFHVAGSFNGWDEQALPMVALFGTDLFVATTTVPRGKRHEYKLVDVPNNGPGVYFEDRFARHVAWDGLDHHDVGEFNGVLRPEEGDPQVGRLEAFRGVKSAILGDSRDVFVYLPAAYDQATCPVLPSLVVHDGNESLTRSPFHLAADTYYQTHPTEAAVLAFVALPSQDKRIDEYTFATPTGRADLYGNALRDEVLPFVSQRYRTCPGARDRGLTGASLGGLVSTYLGLRDPATWGYIGAQSPSYWWEDQAIFPIATSKPVASTRIYVDNGCSASGVDQDGCDDAAAFVKLLDDKGWDVTHVVEVGGEHDWSYWQARWPQMLGRFREGRSGCE
jgi:iron(III)-enterobactin esterase